MDRRTLFGVPFPPSRYRPEDDLIVITEASDAHLTIAALARLVRQWRREGRLRTGKTPPPETRCHAVVPDLEAGMKLGVYPKRRCARTAGPSGYCGRHRTHARPTETLTCPT